MCLTEDEFLMGYKDTDQNISARSLTLLIFAVGWALCGRPRHGRGSIFCDPTQTNPVANGPNPTHETSLQNNPTQPKPTEEDRSHNHHTQCTVVHKNATANICQAFMQIFINLNHFGNDFATNCNDLLTVIRQLEWTTHCV